MCDVAVTIICTIESPLITNKLFDFDSKFGEVAKTSQKKDQTSPETYLSFVLDRASLVILLHH